MHYCYILFSSKLNKFYVGESPDPDVRLIQHNSGYFNSSFTSKANDWNFYLVIPCENLLQARKLERYIKKQKSRKFIEKLKMDPTFLQLILNKL